MKKILTLLILGLMVFSLFGCSKNDKENQEPIAGHWETDLKTGLNEENLKIFAKALENFDDKDLIPHILKNVEEIVNIGTIYEFVCETSDGVRKNVTVTVGLDKSCNITEISDETLNVSNNSNAEIGAEVDAEEKVEELISEESEEINQTSIVGDPKIDDNIVIEENMNKVKE